MDKEKIKELDLQTQIKEWAKTNNNTISYTMLIDIIKEESKEFDDNLVGQIMYELTSEGINIEPFDKDEDYEAESEEPDKFIPADVNIGQKPLNVYNLMERLEFNEIDLHPGFQRHGGLWDYEKQSRLIESLMLKIPLPAFYFDASKESKWIVIDGLQRLTAFKNYLIGTKQDPATGEYTDKLGFEKMQYLTDFNGLTFDELPRQYIRRIKEAPIIAYTVEKGTPDEVVFNIFQRINTGGLRLEDQEIRHALYPGKGINLAQKLADSKEFLEATQYSIKRDRMLDREYTTRFLAFTELDYKKEYKGNIDNFLIKALKRVNTYDSIDIERITENFKRIMKYTNDIFGKYAFRKYNLEWRRGPINKAIFELWSICFYDLTYGQLDEIVKRKDKFLRAFCLLLQNMEFINALKAGDPYSFERRIEMTKKMIKEFLCLQN